MAENSQENRRNRAAHLSAYRWKPGQSGNPGGRPKKTLLADAYRALLETEVPGDRKRRTYAEKIAIAVAKAAMRGKTQAASEIADRTEGKPRQALETSGYLNLTVEEIDARIRALAERARARLADRKEKPD